MAKWSSLRTGLALFGLCAVAACSTSSLGLDPDPQAIGGSTDAAVPGDGQPGDATPIDGAGVGTPDADLPGPEAGGADAAIDAGPPSTDAPVVSPIDAAIGAPIDAAADTSIDAASDSPLDAAPPIVDAAVDAPDVAPAVPDAAVDGAVDQPIAAIDSTPDTAAARIVFADSFDGYTAGANATMFKGNWTVTDGTVDLIGTGYFDLYPGKGFYVDLDGSTNNCGRFASRPLSLSRGEYALAFALGGSQRGDSNTVTVTLGGAYRETFTLPSTAPLAVITRRVTIAGPTTISLAFENAGGDNLGAILDDVSLTAP